MIWGLDGVREEAGNVPVGFGLLSADPAVVPVREVVHDGLNPIGPRGRRRRPTDFEAVIPEAKRCIEVLDDTPRKYRLLVCAAGEEEVELSLQASETGISYSLRTNIIFTIKSNRMHT